MYRRLIVLALGTFAAGTGGFVIAGILPLISGSFEVGVATAAFLASEKAGAITGTFVNVTSGTFPS
jgi:predicted MFS family arabinose efflux permease